MRPIKFKAKSIEEHSKGEWVEGNLSIIENEKHGTDAEVFAPDYLYSIQTFKDEHIEVDPKTVSEYTCILDSDENEIFENHIVGVYEHFADEEITIGVYEVVNGFRQGYPAFTLANSDEITDTMNTLSWLAVGQDFYFKVIGNVFDDPELLQSEPESNQS